MDGGDLKTLPRQHGGFIPLLKLFGLGQDMSGGDLKTLARQHGGFLGLLKLFGGDITKEMSDPKTQQMLMQRGGFPWAALLLPALLGKGQDSIHSQMSLSRDPVMLRGGMLPALLTRSLPLLKEIGTPLALGALASLGDNVVDKIFGKGMKRTGKRKTLRSRRPRKHRESGNLKAMLKRKGKTFIRKNLRKTVDRKNLYRTGRRLFDEVKKSRKRLESKRSSSASPFAQRLSESIARAQPTVTSSNIGPSFNI